MSIATKITLLFLSCLLVSGSALAEEQKQSREREALRRSQQQLQQVQQELAGLKEKLIAAEQASESGNKELQSAKVRARNESQKTSQLQAALEESQKQAQAQGQTALIEKTEIEKRLAQTLTDLARTQRELAQAVDQVRRLQTELAGRTRDINSCESRNGELYKSGRELIEQCQIQAIEGSKSVRYPATGLQRVEIENLLESYRDRLDDQKLSSSNKSP